MPVGNVGEVRWVIVRNAMAGGVVTSVRLRTMGEGGQSLVLLNDAIKRKQKL